MTDQFLTEVLNANLIYAKNCRIVSETLVASTSSTAIHTDIVWDPSYTPTNYGSVGTAGYRTDYCCWGETATTECQYSTGSCASGTALESTRIAGKMHFTDALTPSNPSILYIHQTNTVYYRIEFEGGNIRYYQYNLNVVCMNTLVVNLNYAETNYLTPSLNGLHQEDLIYSSTSIT